MSDKPSGPESPEESIELEVDEVKVERATAALIPFVQKWGLPLNPENLNLMAYALLKHTGQAVTDFQAIQDDVNQMIDEDAKAHRHMLDAMARPTDSE